ncbi:MAG: T9SS type A sorting domain-containing protein [Candidatus Marinimicrobia bacterium]|nr:T9SS type A sorting domain-containing protein [Candidatus Neomarinimicrobiota bacterium]
MTPNPFNPVTRIPYFLDKDREIEILLYDLSGRQVRTLYRGKQQAGTHTLRFDASDLSSGV